MNRAKAYRMLEKATGGASAAPRKGMAETRGLAKAWDGDGDRQH